MFASYCLPQVSFFPADQWLPGGRTHITFYYGVFYYAPEVRITAEQLCISFRSH